MWKHMFCKVLWVVIRTREAHYEYRLFSMYMKMNCYIIKISNLRLVNPNVSFDIHSNIQRCEESPAQLDQCSSQQLAVDHRQFHLPFWFYVIVKSVKIKVHVYGTLSEAKDEQTANMVANYQATSWSPWFLPIQLRSCSTDAWCYSKSQLTCSKNVSLQTWTKKQSLGEIPPGVIQENSNSLKKWIYIFPNILYCLCCWQNLFC